MKVSAEAVSRPTSSLADDEGLLISTGQLLGVAGLALVAFAWLADMGQDVAAAGIGLCLTSVAMLSLNRWGRPSWALQTVCMGLLSTVWVTAYVQDGLYSLTWIFVPLVAMLSGWYLALRHVVLIGLVNALMVVVMLGLHQTGQFGAASSFPLMPAVLVLLGSTLGAYLGVHSARSVMQHSHDIDASQAQVEALFDSTAEMIWSVALPHFGLMSWNQAFGRTVEEVQGVTPRAGLRPAELWPLPLAETWERWYQQVLFDQQVVVETPGLRPGTELEARFNLMVRDGVAFGISVFCRDITDSKRAQARAAFLAFNDPLTGLFNRVMARERLAQALSMAERHKSMVAVISLDIDRFKEVNDSFGHSAGDQLLRTVGERLKADLRQEDSVFRLSGDEFMAVLADLQAYHLIDNACQRIQTALQQPCTIGERQLHPTLCMGVAIYPRDGLDGEVLMRHADTALQDAKKAGEGQYRFFDQRMNDTLMHYVEVRDALRLALERGELLLHYQPQVHLPTGRVHGFEALMRWQRPGHGLVPPGQFIQVAEQSGLIEPMGRWALAEACRQAAAWRSQFGDDWTMSVNLSGVQFRGGRVQEDVCAALNGSGLPPRMLELELTESLLLDHSDTLLSLMGTWRQQGLSIAIDDFGTGYSSLSYLKHLPVDRVKIDRAFVHGLSQDSANQAIVQGVVQMARGLHLQTIAEGVEVAEDLALLTTLGCDVVQGYAYARPMPARDVVDWWQSRNVQQVSERV